MATLVKRDGPGGVDGDPPQWAVDRAQALVAPGETILGIYTISEKNRTNATLQLMTPMLVLPCFWPHFCILSPCICACIVSSWVSLGQVFIVTDKRIYRSVDECNEKTCSTPRRCCGGRDSADAELSIITSMETVKGGALCCLQLFPTKRVVLRLPFGHPLANAGARKRTPNYLTVIYCDDPEAVMRLIRDAKDKASTAASAVVAPGMVTATVMAAPVVQPGIVQPGIVQPMEMEREDDPMTQLKKLKELLDMGAITQAEFDEKKGPLLEKM